MNVNADLRQKGLPCPAVARYHGQRVRALSAS